MRICHFCATWVEGAYFEHIARGLIENEDEVLLVELGEHRPPSWLHKVPKAKYYSLKVTRKLLYPLAIIKLARLIRQEQVDLLHTHMFYGGLIGIFARMFRRRTKLVLMRHHTSVVRMLGTKLHIFADKWMAERADVALTVSDSARKYMLEVDGIKGDVEFIYLGFDFDKFKPDVSKREQVRKEFGFDDSNFVIGYMGNFAPNKGHRQLIEAFASIKENIPSARLFIAGTGSLEEIPETVEKFNLHEKVIFAGWRNDAEACLNAMDLFVQPSLSEAFSQVLIEAMGVGLPVIATNVGAANEVIESGHNGIIIEPDNIVAMASAIEKLYSDKPLTQKIAENGRQNVRGQYTIGRMVSSHFNLYKSLLT